MIDLFIKTYNLMGYDSLTPGEIDLSWGIAELKKISKQAKFTFLLANLLERQTQKPVFRPYLIKELGGIKIGLLGLISNRFPLEGPSGGREEKYQIAEPIEAARKIVTDLKKENCKGIIAMAHMEENEQRKIAEAFREVYFVVSGHTRSLKQQPVELNNAQILTAGTRGEYLGQMDFLLKEEKEKRLLSRYQIVPLREYYQDHPQTAKLVDQYKMGLRHLLAKGSSNVVSEKTAPVQDQPLAYAISSFAGDEVCLSCHPQQHQQWKKTGHSRAYQTLVKDNRSEDLTCLPCHTSGYGEVTDSGAILQNVQCEACHGTRRGHPENQQKFPPVSEKQGLICHNPAKSPNFDYIPYLSKVRCPTPR
jgi:hypothetical protein